MLGETLHFNNACVLLEHCGLGAGRSYLAPDVLIEHEPLSPTLEVECIAEGDIKLE